MFSTRDVDYHARYRRCVNNAFTMMSLVTLEPLVDSTTKVFLDQTEKLFAQTGKICIFNNWLQYFAFDVVGSITFSKRLGFVDRNEDVDGILDFLTGFGEYSSLIGQMPGIDSLLRKNVVLMQLARWGFISRTFPLAQFALGRVKERELEMKEIQAKGADAIRKSGQGIDLLSRFNIAVHERPDFMNHHVVLTTANTMVSAGSETTGISLSAVFSYLAKHPRVHAHLLDELSNGTISFADSLVSWAESQRLLYLDAMIQEALRMYPALGLLLERIFPPQGAEICGHLIPGGTTVGCNA
ncbi:cytochrome P450 [Trichodelitschia bisporula]|uniref:Cytochrome P450 n=1 Tax=Trichodelitschia bisporula TaxID=703511 RepID=A0A6G1I4G2_9PEZI|nr:cytochrome P450 [Trichodelitschia bisporula]